MALTFLKLKLILFILTINLKYFIYFTPNIYFLILIYRPTFCNLFKTFLILTLYLSLLSKYINILCKIYYAKFIKIIKKNIIYILLIYSWPIY